MHISEVEAYRRDKEHLMRNEGSHPANRKASYEEQNFQELQNKRFQTDNMPVYTDDGADYPMKIKKDAARDPSKVIQGI